MWGQPRDCKCWSQPASGLASQADSDLSRAMEAPKTAGRETLAKAAFPYRCDFASNLKILKLIIQKRMNCQMMEVRK